MSRQLPHLLALLLMALLAAPLGAMPARASVSPAQAQQTTPTRLADTAESESNDTISDIPAADQSNLIGDSTQKEWTQRVSGTIGSLGDVDYYRFVVSRPASSVKINLGNLSADYDLVLGGGAASLEEGEPGLDGVAEVGAQISSIGAQISSIGAQISSIGAQISSIGAQISSIGAQISSISANAGTTPEQIDTLIWLPGTYYVAVSAANGEFSATPYSLEVTLLGSALAAPKPAPEVRLLVPRPPQAQPANITTLYLINSRRMAQAYPESDQTVASIKSALQGLATRGPNPAAAGASTSTSGIPEYGYLLDIADLVPINNSTTTISDVYTLWDSNAANPFYANYVAGLIDNLVEAAISPTHSSGVLTPTFGLGNASPANAVSFPNVKYVVLVGGDESVPFFRLPDLTTIANEADYLSYTSAVAGGLLDPAQALGAALKNRTILSDNPYGALRPYRFPGSPIFLPRLAVGRLVESPDDIQGYLNRYNALSSSGDRAYTVDTRASRTNIPDAFVSGYDFLKDQADEVTKTLTTAGLDPGPGCATCSLDTLVNDSWSSTNLREIWFNNRLDTEFSDTTINNSGSQFATQLASVNAHFDHWQLLPASDTAGNFPAQRLVVPSYLATGAPGGYFSRTLGYSVGCHSGYSVPASALRAGLLDQDLYGADFAQAFNRHAGNWVGNTGYGYGTLDGVDYSERLAVLLTEQLFTRVTDPMLDSVYIGQPIGAALLGAKQRYLRNASTLTQYDAKSVQVMTLYGLPWIRFFGPEASLLAPPPEDGTPGTPPPAERRAPVPTPNSNGLLERTITVNIDLDAGDYRTIARTGSKVLVLDPADFRVSDSFVGPNFPAPKLRVFENNQAGLPTLPRFAYDISALNNAGNARLVVRDVQFIEGSYGQVDNFNPQITRIVSETDDPLIATNTEPSFAAGAGIWYPDKFFGFSSVVAGDTLRDQLVAAAAQFRGDANGSTGLLRPYSRMVFKVLYIDPKASGAVDTLADTSPPTIKSVRLLEPGGIDANSLAAASTKVVVIADDGAATAGMQVRAVYVQGGSWQQAIFTRPNPAQAPRRWVADLPLLAGDVRLIVRATDAVGNSSYFTAKGSFAPARDPRLFLPIILR